MIAEDLVETEPEDEEASMTGIEIYDDSKEDIQEVESLATAEPMDENTPQPTSAADSPLTRPIDLDEASRSSQAATPYESTAEPEQDRMDVVDEEGVTSGDEPLLRARLASAYAIALLVYLH